jgi:hypothetical protein
MAKFTEIEEQLLNSVKDTRLQSGLALIRQAVEDIWRPEVRIIQAYTDHGIEHSERLAGFAAKLLRANDGQDLSSREMYLLLAGIYLHDIGMQCDVLRFPEIKKKAEDLGAVFNIEFTAKTANEYNTEEQQEIRKNHHYLTAAWINYAYTVKNRDKETVLSPAIKTVPKDMVADLIDICKFHSKLLINSCDLKCQLLTNGRKRLVAALLRFSDELDIDVHRVSIETVKNFSFDPRNSVYWWLHNNTYIDFKDLNVLLLSIHLHPDDMEKYGESVYSAFIKEFEKKNHSVLKVLQEHRFPIVISDDSKVEKNEYNEALPPEIKQALKEMQKKESPLLELTKEVQSWLRAIGYEVGEIKQDSDARSVHMLAIFESGTVKQNVLVRCIGGEITAADVEAIDKDLDRKTPQGWLISDKRVSDSARKQASEDEGIQVFTLSEFLRHKVWGPYIDALNALVLKAKIPDLYVDPGCYRQDTNDREQRSEKEAYTSLDDYMDKWLDERGMMHISLLGDFGSGKTWFCRHYAYRQLNLYLDDPGNKRLPLLITLRDFNKATTGKQVINDALLEQYKLPFAGSAFDAFQEMNKQGKLLLILDGFDEMARKVDYQTVVDNFWELASLVDDKSKIILTSRTEYFRWAEESEKILGGEEFGRRTIVLTPPKFEVLYLEAFNDDQIQEVISKRLGSEQGPAVAERIMKNKNLAEMIRKPVLVELLLASMDEVSIDILKNQAMVYLYATNKLLLRNISAEKTFTSTSDKLYFLCELAWEMIKSGELRIHYTEIPKRINEYFGEQIKDQHELDTWDYDLRNQTMLHRDAAGYYEFAHKSLAEYFVAFKFVAELGCLAQNFSQTYCEAGNKVCKIPFEAKDIEDLAQSFGFMLLRDEQMKAVRELLWEMLDENCTQRLWQLIDETKHKTPEQVKYCGSNAVYLLKRKGVSFEKADMAQVCLFAVDFSGISLNNADLHGAYLGEAILGPYSLEKTNLCGADLIGISLKMNIGICSLCWSNDGKYLWAGCSDGSLRQWDTDTWQESILISGLRGAVFSILAMKDEQRIVAGDRGNTAILWNISSQTEIRRFNNPHGMGHQMALSPDENFLACVDSAQKVIVFDMESGEQSKIFQTNVILLCVAFSQDGKRLIAGGDGDEIFVWDFGTGQILDKLNTETSSGYKICHSRYQDKFLSYGYGEKFTGNYLECWNSLNGEQIFSIKCRSGSSLSYSYDESKFACAEWFGSIGLYDSESGELIQKINSDDTRTIAFSPDDRYLASGDIRSTIRIWDINENSPNFGKAVKILDCRMNCSGMQIKGAHGLDQEIEWKVQGEAHKGSLAEYFVECGATL